MRAVISGAAIAGMAGTLFIGAPIASAGGAGTASDGGGVPVCEVVTMHQPANSQGGVVMDLEHVRGRGTVYAGGLTVLEPNGIFSQQPVVWDGTDGPPQVVGPPDMDGVVHELRRNGLISGQSIDAEGREYAWFQSLHSGRITIVDAGATERFWVPRINDRGAAAGFVWVSDVETEARVWQRHVDQRGRVLAHDGLAAQAWDITNDRRVAGSIGLGEYRFQAVIWDADGTMTRLASNPGSVVDTSARLINERGEAAGSALWGDQFTGHVEAARWRTPEQLESLGLVPDGGYSAAYGQSEGGWIVGVAEHAAPSDGHAVLWTDEPGSVRVLPSPYAVAHGIDDWRQWQSTGAHAVHDRLDQVGGSAQSGLPEGEFREDPVVYVNASHCGELVPTTHTAFWEQPVPTPVPTTDSSTPVTPQRPADYDPAALDERFGG